MTISRVERRTARWSLTVKVDPEVQELLHSEPAVTRTR
jgi:hypothetical protein